MSRDSVVVLCMPERGHVNRLLPVVQGLAERGLAVHVLTDDRFREDVERHGGSFFDVFERFPIEAADPSSIPVPSRYVSFAAVYLEPLVELVASLGPGLLVYDTFAVVAPLIGRRLGIPWVNCCSGHAAVPSRMIAAMRASPRVRTSRECEAAVRRLRTRYGLERANPFSYFDAASPHLNLYCEPEPFLPAADRPVFEPVAFMGSLAPEERDATSVGSESVFDARRDGLRVYVSFGTVIWRYFSDVASAALGVLADAFEQLGTRTCISLGGHAGPGEGDLPRSRPGVRIEGYVDQWAVLREADLFVTHHGLNSTHEAVYHRVPMISYPFFGDQPDQARRCAELGLSLPLVDEPQKAFGVDAVLEATARIREEGEAFARRLARARDWEIQTIRGRGAVMDRLVALMQG